MVGDQCPPPRSACDVKWSGVNDTFFIIKDTDTYLKYTPRLSYWGIEGTGRTHAGLQKCTPKSLTCEGGKGPPDRFF